MGQSCHADIRFVYVTLWFFNANSQASWHILVTTYTRDEAEKARGVDRFTPPVANQTYD